MQKLSNCILAWTLPEFAFLVGLLAMTAYAAVSDGRTFRIPNSAVLAVVGLFLARYGLLSTPVDFKAHLIIAGISFVVLFIFYISGLFGAGDAKLITALMLWAGPEAGLQFIFTLAIAGGAFAACLLLLGAALRTQAQVIAYIPSSRLVRWAERGVCPYGIPIFIAVLWVAPQFISALDCQSSQPLTPAFTFQFASKAKLFWTYGLAGSFSAAS